MGAWGIEAFENDNAMDWAGEIEELGEGEIDMPLNHIVDEDCPEASLCCEALAAAEVVAAMAGRPGKLPENVAAWVKERKSATPDVIKKAHAAVYAILTNSELKDLWSDSPDHAAWQKVTNDLLSRLA